MTDNKAWTKPFRPQVRALFFVLSKLSIDIHICNKNQNHLKMIADIDPIKSAATSLVSVMAGTLSYISYLTPTTLEVVNTIFQHVAWLFAITAALVSIINGAKGWKIFHKKPNLKNKLK